MDNMQGCKEQIKFSKLEFNSHIPYNKSFFNLIFTEIDFICI